MSSKPSSLPHETAKPVADRQGTTTDPENWIKNYGDILYKYALSRLGKEELAEEVVQETFFSAFSALNTYTGAASERTWLFAILKRNIWNCVDRRWKGRRQISLSEEANPENILFGDSGKWRANAFRQIPQIVEDEAFWQTIRDCLASLPSNLADVFMLSVLEEINSEEICKVLEISASNLWVRLHRARLGLAKCVSEKWSTDGKV